MDKKTRQQPGFNLYRRSNNVELLGQDRWEFENNFPDHAIYFPYRTVITIVRRAETGAIIKAGQNIVGKSAAVLAGETIARSPERTKRALRLPPKRLSISGPDHKDRRKIMLLLEDSQSVLEEERLTFLKILADIAGVGQVEPTEPFVPKLEIGHVLPQQRPSLEALQALAAFIPDLVRLTRVQSFPNAIVVKDKDRMFKNQAAVNLDEAGE